MPRRSSITPATLLAIAILGVTAATSCTSTDPGSPIDTDRAAAATEASAPTTWARTMRQLDERFDIVRSELLDTPAGNLRAVADAATASAELVRLGYGVHRRRDVKDFARLARGCESWLLRIAAEANQGRGAIARDLLRTGEPMHCVRCHDAASVRRW